MALETREWFPELVFDGKIVPEGLIFWFWELEKYDGKEVAVYTPEGVFEMVWKIFIDDNDFIILETDRDNYELRNGFDMYDLEKDEPYCDNIFVFVDKFISSHAVDEVKTNAWIVLWDET